MKLIIKPVNIQSFEIEGEGKCENGIYYIKGQSFPEEIVEEIEENINIVYNGIAGTEEEGKRIAKEDALLYACLRCGVKLIETDNKRDSADFKAMFVEWFYSGNWIKEESR